MSELRFSCSQAETQVVCKEACSPWAGAEVHCTATVCLKDCLCYELTPRTSLRPGKGV